MLRRVDFAQAAGAELPFERVGPELPRCQGLTAGDRGLDELVRLALAARWSDGVVRRVDDLKSALVLSGGFAAAAASAVPLLLPSLPPEARSLPLPLPVFCAALAVQLVVLYGLLAFAGLRLARARGLEPAPELTAVWDAQAACGDWGRAGVALALGLGCGAGLVAAVAAIRRFLPGTLPGTLHPPGLAAALAGSTAGSLGEEILFRLFALSLLLRLLPPGRAGAGLAVGVSSLAFAAAHAPGFAFLFGGWQDVPPVSWVWLIALNGLLGVAFGAVFLRHGVVCAVLAHLGTDVVWHALSPLLLA
jgi:hypothetical protein